MAKSPFRATRVRIINFGWSRLNVSFLQIYTRFALSHVTSLSISKIPRSRQMLISRFATKFRVPQSVKREIKIKWPSFKKCFFDKLLFLLILNLNCVWIWRELESQYFIFNFILRKFQRKQASRIGIFAENYFN